MNPFVKLICGILGTGFAISGVVFIVHVRSVAPDYSHATSATVHSRARGFYSHCMAYFADNYQTNFNTVTVDDLPDYYEDSKVIITGGPMIDDNGFIYFEYPMIFRYKYPSRFFALEPEIAYLLKPDGDAERVHWDCDSTMGTVQRLLAKKRKCFSGPAMDASGVEELVESWKERALMQKEEQGL